MAGARATAGSDTAAIVSADGGWVRLANVGDDVGIDAIAAGGMADPQAGVGAGDPHAAVAAGATKLLVPCQESGGEIVGAAGVHIAWCWTSGGVLRGALRNDLLDNSSGLCESHS